MYRNHIKRGLDLLLSGLAIVLLWPVCLLIGLLVWLDDPGPVLFFQPRVGRDQKPFTLWKFRTMRMSAPPQTPTGELQHPEQYITRVGAVLRKTSLDELPQLVQIFTGDMSIVGPRPVLAVEGELIALRERNGANALRPGLTGWAQINGRDELLPPVKAAYDGEYAKNLSFSFDCRCFFATIGKVLRREGVVEGERLQHRTQEKKDRKSMKILVVSQHYRPEPFRLSDLCETLVEQGHEVTVVTGVPNYPEGEIYPGYEKGKRRDENINGVHVHRCPLIPRKQGILFRILNYFSFPLTSSFYTRRMKESFDVVFMNQTSPVMMAAAGLAYAKKHGVRSVLYCMDLWPESLTAGGIRVGSLPYKVFLKISRRIYRQADVILTSSLGFEKYFMKVLELPTDNLHYMPQYAEELFKDVGPRPAGQKGFHVMFAGNIGVMQSVETIVEAARILENDRNIHFHIVGDGSALEDNRRLAAGLKNITFHGRHDLQEMPRFYAMADAMLVTLKESPSISYTLPGKVQSYMAAGKAIIGAASGGTTDVVAQADCGLCGEPENAAQLARNIRTMSKNPEMVRRFGENARAYYEQYFCKESFFDRLTGFLQGDAVQREEQKAETALLEELA